MSELLTPIQIKNISLKNKLAMSPMCQYSAKDGFINNWHYVHYGSRAVGGCGTIIVEATAVVPEGRISHADLGIWQDEHIEGLSDIVSFMKQYNVTPGIQLAHAGRKASCGTSVENKGMQLKTGSNSWQTVSASPIPFNDTDNPPIQLSIDEIKHIVNKFKESASRAIKAGFEIIEIHAAHGYLIHQFLSPLTNQRTDEYGGTFENRVRFLKEIVEAIKGVVTEKESIWVRISATDWMEQGWDIDQSVELAKILKGQGVDLIDVSTGGTVPHASIPVAPNYQVAFAERIKREVGIKVGAVGLITSSDQAEELLLNNKCDIVFLGRELLRNPYFALEAGKKLDGNANAPIQYMHSY